MDEGNKGMENSETLFIYSLNKNHGTEEKHSVLDVSARDAFRKCTTKLDVLVHRTGEHVLREISSYVCVTYY